MPRHKKKRWQKESGEPAGGGEIDVLGARTACQDEALPEQVAASTALQNELAVRQMELERQAGLLLRAQSDARRYADAERVNEELRAQVRELQTRVDGRKDGWTGLRRKIAQYQDTLTGMEQVLRGSEEELARKESERALLSTRVIELERRCSELGGRLEERDAASREIQQQLHERTEQVERLQAELRRVERNSQEALGKAASLEKLVASLEQGIARRDEALADLEKRLETQHEAMRALEREHDRQSIRIVELEQGLAERLGTIEALRGEIEAERQAASSALDELQRECNELRGRAEASDQIVAQLTDERDESREHVEAAQSQLEHLETQRTDAAREASDLRTETVALQARIHELEAELQLQRQTTTLPKELAPRADEPVTSPRRIRRKHARSMQSSRRGESFDHARLKTRKPIALLQAADGTSYRVDKPKVTIGRALENDICIHQDFVSRSHARLITRAIGTMIEDVGSRNGVLVNSEPVDRPRLLADGDIVSLGKLNLKFVELDGR